MSRAGFTLPNTFATKTVKGPLSDLDSNFNPLKNAILDSGNGWVNYSTVGGTVNAITLTNTPPCLTLNSGATFVFQPTGKNTGATTINVDGLGAQSVLNPATNAALVGGELSGLTTVVFVSGTGFYVTGGITISSNRFNAIGNPNFEVDQINVGGTVSVAAAAKICDRWYGYKNGTLTATAGRSSAAITVPGTNFLITNSFFRVTLTTQEVSLGASDVLQIWQYVEGPQLRELFSDVHSVQLLVRSSVAPLKFGFLLQDSSSTHTLSHLCTISSANTWTLIAIPNIPVWMGAGTWSTSSGAVGYLFLISLAAGSGVTTSANDTWLAASGNGALGQDNFASKPVNSTFDIAFVQHEPGPLCTSLIDKPFSQNYQECLRYYCKSYDYGTAFGTVNSNGVIRTTALASQNIHAPIRFPTPMAKIPIVAGYSDVNGAPGVNDSTASTGRAISSSYSIGLTGFGGFVLGTVNTNPAIYTFHYTADTGW